MSNYAEECIVAAAQTAKFKSFCLAPIQQLDPEATVTATSVWLCVEFNPERLTDFNRSLSEFLRIINLRSSPCQYRAVMGAITAPGWYGILLIPASSVARQQEERAAEYAAMPNLAAVPAKSGRQATKATPVQSAKKVRLTVHNIETYVPVVEKAIADEHYLWVAARVHDDEILDEVQFASKQDGSLEMEVIAHSPSHKCYMRYFAEVNDAKELISLEPSAMNECETCEHLAREDDNMIQYYRRGN